jgi:hypothetical protein
LILMLLMVQIMMRQMEITRMRAELIYQMMTIKLNWTKVLIWVILCRVGRYKITFIKTKGKSISLPKMQPRKSLLKINKKLSHLRVIIRAGSRLAILLDLTRKKRKKVGKSIEHLFVTKYFMKKNDKFYQHFRQIYMKRNLIKCI